MLILFVFCKCNKLSTWELAVLLINSLEFIFKIFMTQYMSWKIVSGVGIVYIN